MIVVGSGARTPETPDDIIIAGERSYNARLLWLPV
jgi:hypothetical protein